MQESTLWNWRRLSARHLPWLYWLFLGGVGTALVSWTWMRWMDPQVDFGVQLYIPWRITLGEQLGRDFIHPYGPLASYVNAALFAVCGVSMRTLIVANLLIYVAILWLLFRILRAAFGFHAAALANFLGLLVYGFGHYTAVNNYTFAAPYSHEATHGLLLLLLLTWRQIQVAQGRQRANGWIDGALFGLICLTKVEVVFAALLMLALGFVQGALAKTRPDPSGHFLRLAVTASAVVGCAWGALALAMPAHTAMVTATSGFLAPLWYSAYVKSGPVLSYLGVDDPLRNLSTLAVYGGLAVGAVALATLLSALLSRLPPARARWLWLLVGLGTAAGVIGLLRESLFESARVFPGLLILATVIIGRRCRRECSLGGGLSNRTWARIFLLVLGVSLMARMALAPKVYHYGFVQSMVAAVFLAGFLVDLWPREILQAGPGRWCCGAVVSLLLVATAVSLFESSRKNYSVKTQPIGTGSEQIRGIRAGIYPGYRNIEYARAFLARQLRPDSSLLVVPEGIMLNYWLRVRHPLRVTNLLPSTMALNSHPVLDDLKAAPPDHVVIVTRMVNENYPPFGSDAASGSDILGWLEQNYFKEAFVGGNPLRAFNENDFGIWILKRNGSPAK